jgi:two-component system, OmpR family, sensor histidine kinase KdpD
MVQVRDPWPAGRAAVRSIVLAISAIALATIATAILEGPGGIADASPVYLVSVVMVAAIQGTAAAIATSVASFLVYDFLFTRPRFTLEVSDPAEWLSLLLFLLVAVVIGRLTALLRERAEIADRRARESVSQAEIGRAIALGETFDEAAAEIAERLRVDAEMDAVEIERRGEDEAGGVIVVAGEPPAAVPGEVPWTLVRSPDGTTDWLRVAEPGQLLDGAASANGDRYMVPIEADGVRLGSIRAHRITGSPTPGRGARRILALAADQLGMAIRRDELRAELTAAEVARRSDALRGAILDSVSHDLRTPISTIRALAGGLVDPASDASPADREAAAEAIDAEAERLGELVRSLLDMSRIQSGALQPDLEACDPAGLVETVAARLRRLDPSGRLDVRVPEDLPPVLVDGMLFDVALANVVDNALRHAPAPAPIVLGGRLRDDGRTVSLTVDDGGPGVPDEALPMLFDRFYRVPAPGEPARHGIGMGLAIARGFVEAMGGSVTASRSDLGGLRVSLEVPVAPAPGGRAEMA